MSAPAKTVPSAVRSTAGPPSNSRRPASSRVSAVAWIPGEDLDTEEWIAAGRRMGSISRCSQWWIGDWIRYGAQKWGEKYVQAARITGYDVASLRNIAWVSAQFEISLRNDKLSWSHHALLAPLDDVEKTYWLGRASTERLSVADLRVELRATRAVKRREELQAAEHPGNGHDALTCPKCGYEIQLASDQVG